MITGLGVLMPKWINQSDKKQHLLSSEMNELQAEEPFVSANSPAA